MASRIDRRRFLAGAASLGPLAACRSACRSDLSAIDARASSAHLASEYTLDPAITYLNHGSIGTIPRVVQQARDSYLATCESNPWLYLWGGAWEQAREDARRSAASVLGCEETDVAITHNTTEGFNVLARGLPLGTGDEVLFSSLNHPGASICWRHAAADRGYTVRQFEFPFDEVPEMTAERVVALHIEQLSDKTRVLVLPHVDNMVGLRHPLAAITQQAKARGVEFVCVDGAQAVGMFAVDLAASGVDVYCTSPHKWLQAPKGIGLMAVTARARQQLRANWVTWGQQRWAGTARRFEDYGTRNLPEVLALGDAITFQQRLGITAMAARRQQLREMFARRVDATAGLCWRSPRSWQLGASLFSVEVVGQQSSDVAGRLWRDHGIVVRAFDEPLKALRISPNVATTDADVDRFFAHVAPA